MGDSDETICMTVISCRLVSSAPSGGGVVDGGGGGGAPKCTADDGESYVTCSGVRSVYDIVKY